MKTTYMMIKMHFNLDLCLILIIYMASILFNNIVDSWV